MENLWAILSVSLVSIISLVGVFTLSLKLNFIKTITLFLVSLSAGTLIGDVFLHIIPELYEEDPKSKIIGPVIILGIAGFFILEKIIHWRHCHAENSHEHPSPLAFTNLFGDAIHNFVDGLVIGVSFLVSTEVGIATTIAVILHEIPQEIGDFGVLIYSGLTKIKALLFNFLSALIAVVGCIIALLVGEASEELSHALLMFAAGGFLYISIADLLPELKHHESLRMSLLQLALFGLGIILMFGLTFVETTH